MYNAIFQLKLNFCESVEKIKNKYKCKRKYRCR